MLSERDIEKSWGKFDFIYSMGLFDYLTKPIAKSVINQLYKILENNGEMVIGNFHVSNPSKFYMEYWLDWILNYRTEQEFIELLEGNPSADVNIFFEDTGSQMFLNIKK